MKQVASCHWTLRMKVKYFSETADNVQFNTRRYISEDRIHQLISKCTQFFLHHVLVVKI